MRYQVIYKVIRDEQGEVIDLINKWEVKTQKDASNWLGVDRFKTMRATIKTFTKKHINEATPVKIGLDEYVILGAS